MKRASTKFKQRARTRLKHICSWCSRGFFARKPHWRKELGCPERLLILCDSCEAKYYEAWVKKWTGHPPSVGERQ
jgi:hypothetical protein